MNISEAQLHKIFPYARDQAGIFLSALNDAMGRRQIDTPQRQAAFLAQVGHESGQLRFVREQGSERYLKRYDVGALAEVLGNDGSAGDGLRYRGRGLLQITGRTNYLNCSMALFGDRRLLKQPELLEQTMWAAESAAWYWWWKGLNTLADRDDFITITRRINGGLNGLEERVELWERARAVLCLSSAFSQG